MKKTNLESQQHLALRVTEFGLRNDDFTLNELYTDLQITDQRDKDYIRHTLTQAGGPYTDNPNHILVTAKNNDPNPESPGKVYRIVPTAFYNYVDYLEIVEARKAANEARLYASKSIVIAIASLMVSVVLGFLGIFYK